MASTYWIDTQTVSQLRDKNEANPTADDGSFDNWSLEEDFILIASMSYGGCNKTTLAAQFKLQWSTNQTDWTDVGLTTEISFDATTTLVDGAVAAQYLASGNPSCGNGWEAGYEVEGDNLSHSLTTTANYYTEIHWALSPKHAVPGTTYYFRQVNVTNSNTPLSGTILSTVTIKPRRILVCS